VESVRPVGSVPELSANTTGAEPPPWVNVWLNGVPAVPVVTAGFATVTPPQTTVSVKFCDDWCGLFFSAVKMIG
jgi:hypothetical protein